jgi:protein gp37
MADTKIEWTNKTWNPIAGCNDKSEGCRNCYARGMARRLELMGSEKYKGLTVLQGSHMVWTGKISFDEGALLQPLSWKKPRMIFVNSMSDLFHENVTDEMRDRIFAVMALCPRHTFQVLTKRPERMLEYVSGAYVDRVEELTVWEQFGDCAQHISKVAKWVPPEYDHTDSGHRMMNAGYWDWHPKWPLPNVWLGVSVENQAAADERIPMLLQTPAAVRFLSCEPLLGPVDLTCIPCEHNESSIAGAVGTYNAVAGSWWPALGDANEEYKRRLEELPRLDWVICGGESGPGARPMEQAWAESLRDQCAAAGVAYFMKQMGSVFGPNKGHDVPAELDIKQFPFRRLP